MIQCSARLCKLLVAVISAFVLVGCTAFAPKSQNEAARPVVQQVDAVEDTKEVVAIVAPEAEGVSTRSISSNVDELQQLIKTKSALELRTAYNGSYGVSLLFNPDALNYYVTLFQQNRFIRVLKTESLHDAEAAFTAYRQETVRLAEVDITNIRLRAEHAKLEKELVQSADELTILQNDVAYQRQQEAMIVVEQQNAERAVSEIAQREKEAREQLKILQSQIRDLQQQRTRLVESTRARR